VEQAEQLRSWRRGSRRRNLCGGQAACYPVTEVRE